MLIAVCGIAAMINGAVSITSFWFPIPNVF
jgi:hypothetical protein